MGDPTTWPRRRRKSRRKGQLLTREIGIAFAFLLCFALVAAVSAQFFGRRGRSFLHAPLSAIGANLMGRRWPSNPNRSGRGATSLSFPGSARDWDPNTDDTKRLRVTLRFKDNANGIVLSDVRAGSLEEPDGSGSSGHVGTSSYKKGSSSRRPKRHRSNKAPKVVVVDRQTLDPSCPGRCDNMFRCMLQGGRTMRASQNLAACPGMFSVCCATWSAGGNLREDIRQGLMQRPSNGGPIMGAQSTLNIFSNPTGSGFTPAFSPATGFAPSSFVPTARGPLQLSSTGVLPPDQLAKRRPLPLPSELVSSSSSRANAGRALSFDSPNSISYSSGTSLTSHKSHKPHQSLLSPTIVFGPHLPPPSRAPSTRSPLTPAPPKAYSLQDIISTDYRAYKCGVSRSAQSKIMGGLDAGYGQFPWTAHIKIRGPYGIDKECGGTLVGRRWILTAGHCTQYCRSLPSCRTEVAQADITYKVILGEYHQLLEEEFPTHAYLAVDVIRHPLYKNIMRLNKGVLESEPRYDIAMLYLDRDARLAPNVAPACLPQPQYIDLPPGALGTVVGWGRIGRHEDSPHSNVLQAATVPVVSDWECFEMTGLLNYEDQVCAGGVGAEASACPGDSGGALQVQDEDGRWMIVGIVSNGPSVCGMQPVVFHKVANSIGWVADTMARKANGLPNLNGGITIAAVP